MNVTFRESYDPDFIGQNGILSEAALSSLRSHTRSLCRPVDFRPSIGNQVVGGAFTVCSVSDGRYLSEIAIQEGSVRTRVRYLFAAPSAVEYNVNPNLVEESVVFVLLGFTIIRERNIGQRESPSLPSFEPLRGGQIGRGIYDPQESGEPYGTVRCLYIYVYGHKCIYLTAYYLRLPDCKCLSTYLCVLIVELRFPGLLTLFFPRYLQAGKSASLTMEWWGDSMRYQVCMGMLNTSFFTARFKHCIAYRLIDASAEKETGQRERSSRSSSQVQMNSYVLSCFLLHILNYSACPH